MDSPFIPPHTIQWCSLELRGLSDRLSDVLVESDLHWEDPSREITLGYEDLHVWRARLDQSNSCTGQCRGSLSGDERTRAGRFRFQKDCERFIARRVILRTILGYYLGIAPAHIEFTYGDFGKPELSFPTRTDLRFNLSHSDGLVFCVVALGASVGVDVERIREVAEADKIVTSYFSSREAADWRSLSSEERLQAFFRHWTRKEARSKAIGCGIANELGRLQTMQAFDEIDNEARLVRNAEANANWIVRDYVSTRDYVASIAFAHPLCRAVQRGSRLK
jgi:4'-phosphopantetheinyl transferase